MICEIGSYQISKSGNIICGDRIENHKVKTENRNICILSDGLGSGAKARELADLTVSIALAYTLKHEPVERTAHVILNSLPIDEKKRIGYSTFTIIDIDNEQFTRIVEFDNPSVQIFRNGELMIHERKSFVTQGLGFNRNVYLFDFQAQLNDRIVVCSDGVTQSGLGKKTSPFGWGDSELTRYLLRFWNENSEHSAAQVAEMIVNQAKSNDAFLPQDDISCTVIYFRQPRKVVVCTGPPFDKENDTLFANKLNTYKGSKVVCGGTTSQIIARELNLSLKLDLANIVPDLPPSATMESVDLVTEGVLTLSRVNDLIISDITDEQSPAGNLLRFLLAHDCIHFLVGTRINASHQNPDLPIELEVRSNLIRKMAQLLNEKFMKEISLEFM
jgi:serine/threonine protein phosphatase PrpC